MPPETPDLLLTGIVLVASLGGLVWSADRVVASARELSVRLGVHPLVIGLTITSVGTSLPEIGTNVAAALSGARGIDASGIAVGNIVGSNLGQITLLLGIAGLVAGLHVPAYSLRRDGGAVLGALLAMFVVAVDGVVGRAEGVVLVTLYLGYLAYLVWDERRRRRPRPERRRPSRGRGATWTHAVVVAIGLAAVVLCSELLVGRAVAVGRGLGADETFLGILVGLGTSLPELTVSLRAIRRDDGALSLGNLLGSNVTDPLLSFGAGATIHAVSVSERTIRFDFPWWFLGTTAALLLLSNDRDLDRREAGVLLMIFGMFLYLRLGGGV